MLRSIGRRFLTVILALLMILDNAAIALAAGLDSHRLLINGSPASDSVLAEYLEPISLSIENSTGMDTMFLYTDDPDDPDAMYEAEVVPFDNGGLALPPREAPYYIFGAADGNESFTTEMYALYVSKATVKTPENAIWNGDNLSWSAVSETVTGGALPGDAVVFYSVSVYRDETLVEILASTSQTQYANVGNHILDPGEQEKYSAGVYHFEVTAMVNNEEYKELFAPSQAQSSNEYTIPLASFSGDNGISEISPSSRRLLPGDSDHDHVEINATVKAGYDFDRWEYDSSNVTVLAPENESTVLRVNEDYAGEIAISVKALTKDITPPTANSPTKGDEAGTIKAVATDSEEGITHYAFSAEETFSWTEAEPSANTFTYKPTKSGKYYFYAKDGGNNETKSSNGIDVTIINYNGFYDNGIEKEESDLLIGNESVTLKTPSRPGWVFMGWYDGDNKIEAIDEHKEEIADYELNALWEKESLENISFPENVVKVYSGEEYSLTVTVPEDITGTKTYFWTKDGTPVVGNTMVQTVKNVADSGTYKVTVKILDSAGNVIDEKTSGDITVTISKAELSLKADDKEIYYGDSAPIYTVSHEGLCAGDSFDEILYIVSSEYTADDEAGSYDIIISEYFADNYEITVEKGSLTVKPTEGTVTVELTGEGTFTYNGDEHCPAIKVKQNGKELLENTDYTVSYSNNINVGTATVTAVLKGNHSGTGTAEFTITKATASAVVAIEDWIYKSNVGVPSLSENGFGDEWQGKVVYEYAPNEENPVFGSGKPENAGNYLVRAVISNMKNYENFTSEPTAFKIEKRKITLTANSEEFIYDTYPHSNAGYTIVGEFANNEGFSSVVVSGTIIDKGEAENTVEYILKENTSPENYEIEVVKGVLTVLPRVLPVPEGLGWSTHNAGKVEWVPVSRDDIDVIYKINLYAEGIEEPIEIVEAESGASTYDLSDTIKEYASSSAENDETHEYYFTLETLPSSNENDNYTPSISTKSSLLHTMEISIEKSPLDFGTVTMGGSETEKFILLEGEGKYLYATTDAGYSFNSNNPWQSNVGSSILSLDSPYVDGDNKNNSRIHIENVSTTSQIGVVITVSAKDIAPKIEGFSAQIYTTPNQVSFALKGSDAIGLEYWAIAKEGEEPIKTPCNGETEFYSTAEEEGAYYAYLWDGSDNCTVIENPINVYRISFIKGNDNATGEMESILKVQNKNLDLPQEEFIYEGHIFQNWKSETTGIHPNGGTYAANTNDTLTAIWTDEQAYYDVEYYYMDTNGNYSETPENTRTFHAVKDTTISYDAKSIQMNRDGFSLDTSPDKQSTITVSAIGEDTLKVYYSRNRYTLSWTYTDGSGEHNGSEQFYYGEDIRDYLGANEPQSNFVGWSLDHYGTNFSTMPAENTTARGLMSTDPVSYSVRYFLQNLEDEGYSLDNEHSVEYSGTYNAPISVVLHVPEGFTFVGTHKGNANEIEYAEIPKDLTESLGYNITPNLYVDVFCSRNTYDLTLNIWDGPVGEGEAEYSYIWHNRKYGESLPQNPETEGQGDDWTVPQGKELTAAQWSTGEAVLTMPAGNVIITRQFVSPADVPYVVEVFLQNENGQYPEGLKRVFTYHNKADALVSVGTQESTLHKISDYNNSIDHFEHYEWDESYPGTVTSGTVTGDGTFALKVYLKRKLCTTTIIYNFYNEIDGSKEFAKVTKKGLWGSTFDYELLAFYGTNENGNFTETPDSVDIYEDILVKGETKADLYDFSANGYEVSYDGTYVLNYDTHYPRSSSVKVDPFTPIVNKIGYDNAKNTLNVYYVEPSEISYTVPVFYNDVAFTGVQNEQRLTYEDAENTYNVNLANKSELLAGAAQGTYTPMTVYGKIVYAKDNSLYIPVEGDIFYEGKTAHYSFKVAADNMDPGAETLNGILNDFKASNPGVNASFNNLSFWRDSRDLLSSNDPKLVITYWRDISSTVRFEVNGIRTDGGEYANGTTHSFEDLCDYTLEGFDISWYEDAGYTTPVKDEYKITKDILFYGKAERKTVKYDIYRFYQKADGGFVELSAISELESISEEGKTIYTLHNVPVLEKEEGICPTFEIEAMETASQRAGYKFDSANEKNIVSAFIHDEGVTLKAYYVREKYTLSLLDGDGVTIHSEKYRFDEYLPIITPQKGGYTFVSWQNDLGEPCNMPSTMPAKDTTLTALWNESPYTQKIYHLFQSIDSSFYKDTVVAFSDSNLEGEEKEISLDGESVTARVYETGFITVSKDDNTYIYLSGDDGETVGTENLLGIIETQENVTVGTNGTILPMENIEGFSFDYALCQTTASSERISSADIAENGYVNSAELELQYYYKRNMYEVTLTSDMGGGIVGAPIFSGAGEYPYGKDTTLHIAMPKGYTFDGWYIGEEKVCSDGDFPITVTENVEYTAHLTPVAIAEPVCSLTGPEELEFDYTAKKENVINAIVSFPEGADSANRVEGYKWYWNGVLQEDTTGSSFSIPIGKTPGEHTIKCEVVLKRVDSGISTTVNVGEHVLIVDQAIMDVKVTGYSGVYDGSEHGITISVNKPKEDYVVYYAEEPLNAENYATVGNTAPIRKANVFADEEGKTASYTVYYYIHSQNGYYEDISGQESVTIYPKSFYVTRGNKAFTKTYDGVAILSPDELNVFCGDKEYYNLEGVLEADKENAYISCTARFNSAHAEEASSIIPENILLVDENKNPLTNYYYDSTKPVLFSGQIKPLEITLSWSGVGMETTEGVNSFDYNGEECNITATIAEGIAIPSGESVAVGEIHGKQSAASLSPYTATATIEVGEGGRVTDYSIKNASFEYYINHRNVTVSPKETAPIVYDGNAHEIEDIDVTGIVDGHQVIATINEHSIVDCGEKTVSIGSIMIIDAEGVNVTSNYHIEKKDKALKITKRPISISGIKGLNKAYDGNTDAVLDLSNVTINNVISGDDIKLASGAITGTFIDKNYNEAPTKITLSYSENPFTGSSLNNYSFDDENSQKETEANILKKTITVKADDKTMTYGDGSVEFDSTMSGFIEGEDEALVSGEVTYSVGEDITKIQKGEYNITPNVLGLSADNYKFVSSIGKLTVLAKEITITPTEETVSRVYNGKTDARALIQSGNGILDSKFYSITGLIEEDTVSVSFTGANFDTKDAGEGKTITITGIGIDSDNYTLTPNSISLSGNTITRKEFTVTTAPVTVTYGDNKPESFAPIYPASAFEGTDTANSLEEKPAYTSLYGDEGYRNVGEYDITPQNENPENQNYDITVIGNTLTVKPATLTITAKLVGTDAPNTVQYGVTRTDYENHVSESFDVSGLKYGEEYEDVVEGDVEFKSGLTFSDEGILINSPSSSPKLTPVVSGLTANNGNYNFVPKSSEIVVSKKMLTISGLTFSDKEYDGTVFVAVKKDIGDGGVSYYPESVHFDGLLERDSTLEKRNCLKVNGVFTDKNVNIIEGVVSDVNINYTLTLTGYLYEHYSLDSANGASKAKITPRPLSVKAKDISVGYGADNTVYSYEITNGTSLASGDKLTGDNLLYDCTYRPDDKWNEVKVYEDAVTVTVSESENNPNFIITNYTIETQPGDLTVTKKKLDTPIVTWSSEYPGTVTWSEVTSIGDINVDHYEVTLLKGNDIIAGPENVLSSDERIIDFATQLHENGEAVYTAKVYAYPVSNENINENMESVCESDAGAAAITVPKVTFAPAAGYGDFISSTSVNGNTNGYVMIPGEKDIPINATMVNETGYIASNPTSSDGRLTISDNNQNGGTFGAKIKLAHGYNGATTIPVQIILQKRPATAKVEIVVTNNVNTLFGYTEEQRPVITATVSHEDDPETQYTYSYKWEHTYKYKKVTDDTGANNEWVFPIDYTVNSYPIICTVTATRKDNNQSCTAVSATSMSAVPESGKVIISRAPFTCKANITGWTYGEEHMLSHSPSISDLSPENEETGANISKAVYQYRAEGEESFSTVKPRNAGNYEVRAIIPETGNYNVFTTSAVKFTIEKAKLATPENLSMKVSETAPYGRFTWEHVTGPKQNANGTEVSVKYEVSLYKQGEADPIYSSVIAENSIDLTDYMGNTGTYSVKLKAVSMDEINCDDSDYAEYATTVNVGPQIEVTGSGNFYGETKPTLTASFPGENVISYQWYRKNALLTGETAATLIITHVNESDDGYNCVMTLQDGTTVYTPKEAASVIPRPVTLTSDSGSKAYDEAPLFVHTVYEENGDDRLTNTPIVDGDKLEYIYHTSITDVQELDNDFGYHLTGNEDDYEFTLVFGTLTVTAWELDYDDFTISDIANVTYNAEAHTPIPTVKNKNGTTMVRDTDYELSYSNNVEAGSATITVTGIGNYSGIIEKQFTILPRPISFTGKTDSKVYTGEEITISDFTVEGIISGHKHNVSYSAKGTNASATPYDGEFTPDDEIIITDSSDSDVTKNYQITTTPGELTITPWILGNDFTVSDAEDKVYNATAFTPILTVKNPNGTSLAQNTDFTLTYKDNENVGEATVTVTGIGNYSGTINKTFNITARTVSFTGETASREYTGSEIILSGITVEGIIAGHKHNVKYSAKGKNASITPYSGEITPKAEVIITDNEGADVTRNYNITTTAGNLTITQSELDENEFTVSGVNNTVYNSEAHTPVPTVTNRVGAVMEIGVDYTVSYADNVNVGTATITISGIGGYKGEITSPFQIEPSPITIWANDKESIVGEPLAELDYVLIDGAIYGTDYLGDITLNVELGEKAKNYPITIDLQNANPNYEITLRNGVYTLKEAYQNIKIIKDGDDDPTPAIPMEEEPHDVKKKYPTLEAGYEEINPDTGLKMVIDLFAFALRVFFHNP